MPNYYCPNCWEVVPEHQGNCPNCGYSLDNLEHAGYDDKLIAALQHPVADRRILAAQILGARQCKRALPIFREILTSEEMNYFFLRSVVLAVANIEDPTSEEILQQATVHPSNLVAQLARELLQKLLGDRPINRWDQHTG